MTLKHLRGSGYFCEIAEHWQSFGPGGGYRKDLLGWVDILALGNEIVGVQATTASNMSARMKKMLGLEGYHRWLKAGGQAWVFGWKKKGNVWLPRVVRGTKDGEFVED